MTENLEETEPVAETKPEYICPVCGFKAVNAKGLAGHMRLAHQKPTKQDGYKEYVDAALDGVLEKLEKAWEQQFRERVDAENKCIQEQGEATQEVVTSCDTLSSAVLELDEKIKLVGKLIESVGNGLIRVEPRIHWCEDDIKGFKNLGIAPKPVTLEHSEKG